MLFLRSFIFNIFYAGWTLILCILALPTLLLPARFLQPIIRLWARGILQAAHLICGLKSEVHGRENIPASAAVYAVKHQSAWDIFILLTLLPRPSFVLKQSLLSIPLVGIFMRKCGVIAINRKKGVQALKLMREQCARYLASGRDVVVFPEGTRSKPGQPGKYHSGTAGMVDGLSAPVIPAALISGHVWGRNAFIKRPGVAEIHFLPALPLQLAKREFMHALENAVENASMALAKSHGCA